MNFIDTHCHLNDEKFSADFDEVVKRAESLGVDRIINFGDTLKSSAQVVKLAEKFNGMYAGVGVHPEEIENFDENKSVDTIVELAANKKVVAIGEIGLDYYWEKNPDVRLAQQKIFVRQLDIARQLNLPPTKRLWQSAKSDLIIIGKKIPTFDLHSRKFLFDSWILRGS